MLWHLNKFRDAKQGINVFKTYIPRISKENKQDRFIADLLTAWTDLTNNEKVNPPTLPEIYNEPLFFNISSVTQFNKSEYLLKKPPPGQGSSSERLEIFAKRISLASYRRKNS